MATLREFMGSSKRGDGRKFRKNKWYDCYWFEPIFQNCSGDWFGLDQDDVMQSFCDNDSLDWEPYIEPKLKKKVKLYSPVGKSQQGYIYLFGKYADKKQWFGEGGETIIGWHEIEVEVDE